MNKYDFSKNIINDLLSNINKNDVENKSIDSRIECKEKKNVLVIITNNINLNNIIMKLMKLRNLGFEFNLILSNKLKESVDTGIIKLRLRPENIYTEKDNIDYKSIISKADIVLVPSMVQNDITKLALGIQDDILSSFMWKVLWENKTLYINLDNSVLDSDNDFLKGMMSDYIDKLYKMGVKSLSSSNYSSEIINILDESSKDVVEENKRLDKKDINKETKVVITEKDILNIKGDCNSISVSTNTIVTPLAKDTAKRKGIKIIKK